MSISATVLVCFNGWNVCDFAARKILLKLSPKQQKEFLMNDTKNLTDATLLLFDIRARLFLIQNLDPLLTDVSSDQLSYVCHDLISSFKRVSADCVSDLAKAIELLE